MATVIFLREVIESMEITGDDCFFYLDPETGEIITVTEEERHLAEDESLEDVPEWQREMLPKIRAALESDRFLELPDRFDIHEWSIMDAFSRAQGNAQTRQELRMPFMEQVPFVHFEVRFDDSAWNKAGTSSVRKRCEKSLATGWRSTDSRTGSELGVSAGEFKMASGDPQRIWFPEMIVALRQEWEPPMSCVALIELRNRQDAMLQAIRSERRSFHPS
ncbi:MAG TPA: hypothetical protein VGK96_20425 [Candidatus Sulfotelmatobacter sp.]